MHKLAIIAGLLCAAPVQAHDFYSVLCCDNRDCRPVSCEEFAPTSTGWLIKATGEVESYESLRIKQSPDGRCHRCAVDADFESTGKTLCIYLPPQGS